MPRWKAIKTFVKHGLLPFLAKGGYKVIQAGQPLINRIATGLYNNQNKSYTESDWRFGIVNMDMTDEDRDHFNHVLGPDEWEAFWSAWGCWDDVHETAWRGKDRRIDIQDYCWTQIDVERSPATTFINEIFGIVDEDGEDNRGGTRRQDDTYYRESADAGYDGYRK
jgi:hypothetical protein